MFLLQWLTFVSATIAAVFQGRRAVQGWLYDQRDRRELRRIARAGWSQTGVDTWVVQLADPDQSYRPATVTIDLRAPGAAICYFTRDLSRRFTRAGSVRRAPMARGRAAGMAWAGRELTSRTGVFGRLPGPPG